MVKALNRLPVLTFSVPDGIQFVEVDQETGKPVDEPSKGTTTEVFADGTIPQQPVRRAADPLEFYEFDQLDPAVETR